MFTNLISALTKFDADKSAAEVQKLLDSGLDPFEIIENGLMQAMDIVGSRFEEGTYFLPELLLAVLHPPRRSFCRCLEPPKPGDARRCCAPSLPGNA